jgi:hypothetical protein
MLSKLLCLLQTEPHNNFSIRCDNKILYPHYPKVYLNVILLAPSRCCVIAFNRFPHQYFVCIPCYLHDQHIVTLYDFTIQSTPGVLYKS